MLEATIVLYGLMVKEYSPTEHNFHLYVSTVSMQCLYSATQTQVNFMAQESFIPPEVLVL